MCTSVSEGSTSITKTMTGTAFRILAVVLSIMFRDLLISLSQTNYVLEQRDGFWHIEYFFGKEGWEELAGW